ncbi:MAG: tetratricopeptide repeat protein [Leptospirales bacterium]
MSFLNKIFLQRVIIFLFILLSAHNHLLSSEIGQEKKIDEILFLLKNGSKDKASTQLKKHEKEILKYIDETKSAELSLKMGIVFFYLQMDEKSEKILNKAIVYDSELSEAYFYLGLINKYGKNLTEAKKYIQKATSIDGNNAKYFLELGLILEKTNDLEAAKKAYQRAIEIEPENTSVHFNLAGIYISNKEYTESEKQYLIVIQMKPDHVSAHYNLGQLYQTLGKHEKALASFSKVIELDENDWRALTKIIQESQALGNKKERDAAREKLYSLYKNDKSKKLTKQGFYIRDQFDVKSGKVFVLEYFELNGKMPKKYIFKLYEHSSEDSEFYISLGSYEGTNTIAREIGDIGPDERMYHLDGYESNGTHYTYTFFKSEPDYDMVKALVLEILSDKFKPVSSSRPVK